MLTQVVVISGKQGSGKSTLAKELIYRVSQKKGWEALELRFASVIYDIHNYALGLLKFYGVDVPKKDGYLLQLLGTQWGREKYGEDVWVSVMKGVVKDVEKARKLAMSSTYGQFGRGETGNILLIISDCRFENEFNAFPDALRVRLEAPEEVRKPRTESWRENTEHPSETGLDSFSEKGMFDLKLKTDVTPINGCVDLILAKLDKGNWIERRG